MVSRIARIAYHGARKQARAHTFSGSREQLMVLTPGTRLGPYEITAERLRRGAMSAADVLRIGMQIADALDRAHRAGVVHRDLKPGNVMITRSGAKLMDFGLARATDVDGTQGGSGATLTALTHS